MLNNIAIVVHCGPNPQLYSFKKAIPSLIDHEYQDAENLSLQNLYMKPLKLNNMITKVNAIIARLQLFIHSR